MKQVTRVLAAAVLSAAATVASATPSTTYWTPATTYTQPYLVPHLTYDTYVAERGMLQNDYGLTIGILPFEKLQAEVGFDAFFPGTVKDNFYLNAKLTIPENAFGAWQPGVSLGIQSVGFKKDYSDYNHLYLSLGKAFDGIGTFVLGGYYGLNENLYVGSDGETTQAGFMASYTSPDIKVGLPGLDKLVVAADYASGKNAFGAFGAGVGFYFTPAVALLTGPVWFNDKDLMKAFYGADFMWTFQIDVDFDLMKKAEPAAAPAPKT